MISTPEHPGFGAEWIGRWVTVTADDVPARLARVAFRRGFDLTDVPATLPIRLSADSRYVLWVNGTELGRGPSRSQPHRRTADLIDIAPALVSGPNVIVALVTFYGSDNAHWQRASVVDGLGSRPCFVVDTPRAWATVATGPEWTASPLAAWDAGPAPEGISALPVEVLDQRALPAGWLAVDGPEWPRVRLERPVHPGPRLSTPPAHPFGRLPLSTLPALSDETVTAVATTVRRVSVAPTGSPPVEAVHGALRRAHDESPAESMTATPDAPLLLTFDFGRVVSGLVEVDVVAPEGTTLDLAYLERPFDPSADNRYLPRAGARVVVSADSPGFRAVETNGMRYVAALLTPPAEATVGVPQLRVRERLSPFAGDAGFSSSDAELERLWRAGLRTVQLNSSDALTDCPTREQRAWVGDGVVHVAVHLVGNADWSLVERHLELCDSPRADGLLPMSVVGDFESGGGFTIPDWSLHWIHAVWLHARAARREEYTRSRLATAERILSWFSRHLVEGVLADVPEWTLVDWSSVFTSGRSAILTALWARGLAEFADLAQWVGDAARAEWARSLRAEVELGFEQFWDADRRLYVDHVVDGRRMPAVSQAVLASAIVAGLVPPDRLDDLIAAMTDESRLVDRGWNAPSEMTSIEQRVADRLAGVQRIDWDAEREIVRAEPFFSAVVHDAVAAAGHAELLPGLLRRWSGFLENGYDTFGECWHWGSPAHGWSSTPTSDLVTHVLGVRPGAFDDDGYVIAPARTGIGMLAARVPTRAGMLAVDLNGAVLSIQAPLPVRVRTWDGQMVDLPAGRRGVDLEAGVVIDEVRSAG
jgi:alpha-L-rhamnosidase